jgi:putative transposase
VSKTGLVSLHGNRYQVDPVLVGRKVELVFDPFDLTFLRVRDGGVDAGTAAPFQITRHAHPKARPEVPDSPPAPTTGIDYLALIDTRHTAEVAHKVNYAAFGPPGPDQPDPDQLELDLACDPAAGATSSGATSSGATSSGATSSGATSSGATSSGATSSGATS